MIFQLRKPRNCNGSEVFFALSACLLNFKTSVLGAYECLSRCAQWKNRETVPTLPHIKPLLRKVSLTPLCFQHPEIANQVFRPILCCISACWGWYAAFPFIRSISLRSRKECHGTGSRHIECRGDVPPEEDRPTKVANMDHIGCGGSLKITLALTAAPAAWWGRCATSAISGPALLPTILTLISDAVSSLWRPELSDRRSPGRQCIAATWIGSPQAADTAMNMTAQGFQPRRTELQPFYR